MELGGKSNKSGRRGRGDRREGMVRPTSLVESFLDLGYRVIGHVYLLAELVEATGGSVQTVSEATTVLEAFLVCTENGGVKLSWILIWGDSRGPRSSVQGEFQGVGRFWTGAGSPEGVLGS